ncbi:MAG: SCO family protein [Ignavibacteria bacterium]|nr:SCO family protein [Ignavibacteria bacterium]MCU7504858.1 SCO family protein [Ignavibacteria bacterium]MCU7518330.1 SCO family protein [Ignavibacteria bacterium]
MKKIMMITLPAALLILGLTGYFALNNSWGSVVIAEKHSEKKDSVQTLPGLKKVDAKISSCCSEKMEEGSAGYSSNSVYQLSSVWKNELGQKLSLGDLKGHKVVLSMIFASCTYACPLIVNDMRKIEKSVADKSDVRFVLVSIDPERDTPVTLLEYSKRQGLELSRWELLTGSKSDIRSLAAVLGFKYQRDSKGDYTHSNLINVLNKEGEVVLQHEGLNKDISDIVGKLKSMN